MPPQHNEPGKIGKKSLNYVKISVNCFDNSVPSWSGWCWWPLVKPHLGAVLRQLFGKTKRSAVWILLEARNFLGKDFSSFGSFCFVDTPRPLQKTSNVFTRKHIYSQFLAPVHYIRLFVTVLKNWMYICVK